MSVTDEDVEAVWAAIVGSDVASICFQASIIRADLRTGLEAFTNRTSAWQPIETAPKDGTSIDVWFVLGNGHAARWPGVKWSAKSERWFRGPTDQGLIHWNATHWQPLPAPPVEQAKTEVEG